MQHFYGCDFIMLLKIYCTSVLLILMIEVITLPERMSCHILIYHMTSHLGVK